MLSLIMNLPRNFSFEGPRNELGSSSLPFPSLRAAQTQGKILASQLHLLALCLYFHFERCAYKPPPCCRGLAGCPPAACATFPQSVSPHLWPGRTQFRRWPTSHAQHPGIPPPVHLSEPWSPTLAPPTRAKPTKLWPPSPPRHRASTAALSASWPGKSL